MAKANAGEQLPQPLLEDWCRRRMTEAPVYLNSEQRRKVEHVCHQHAEIRGWVLHAASARSNHVHIAVTADTAPKKVRDQFKANATRVLREPPGMVAKERIWTRGGDIEILDDDESLERVVQYINEAQDKMGTWKVSGNALTAGELDQGEVSHRRLAPRRSTHAFQHRLDRLSQHIAAVAQALRFLRPKFDLVAVHDAGATHDGRHA